MPDEDETLSELFARDPLTYSQQDIARVIEYFRLKRESFVLTGKAVKKEVDLKDLGLLP